MRVLFDNGVPRGVASVLEGHAVEEARDRGWDRLKNGDLLDAAEAAGFDVFVTTDRNIRFQQNLADRTIAIVGLSKGSWPLGLLSLYVCRFWHGPRQAASILFGPHFPPNSARRISAHRCAHRNRAGRQPSQVSGTLCRWRRSGQMGE